MGKKFKALGVEDSFSPVKRTTHLVLNGSHEGKFKGLSKKKRKYKSKKLQRDSERPSPETSTPWKGAESSLHVGNGGHPRNIVPETVALDRGKKRNSVDSEVNFPKKRQKWSLLNKQKASNLAFQCLSSVVSLAALASSTSRLLELNPEVQNRCEMLQYSISNSCEGLCESWPLEIIKPSSTTKTKSRSARKPKRTKMRDIFRKRALAKIAKNRGAHHKDDGIAIHMLWKDATAEEIARCQKEADQINIRNGMEPFKERTNGYLLFMNSVRDEVVDEVILTGAMNQQLVMKKVAARWREMEPEEKAKWRAAATKRNKQALPKKKISKSIPQPKLRVDSVGLSTVKIESKRIRRKNEGVKVKIERGKVQERAADSARDTEEEGTSAEESESSE